MNSLPRASSEQDEIDLLELFRALWKRKWFIFLVVICAMILATVYAYFKPPVYVAKIVLGPPIAADIAAFNYRITFDTPMKPITTNDAYLTFRGVLFADTTLHIFQSEEKRQISSSVSIVVRNEPLGQFSVTAKASSSRVASQSAQEFITLAHKIALNDLNKSREREKRAIQTGIHKEMSLLRERNQIEKKKQITDLQNAMKIAQSLGLENAQPFRNVETVMNNAAYLRGAKALKAEIQNLEHQISNDAFNLQLINLEYEKFKLAKMQPVKNNVALAKANGEIEISTQHLNTKRIIIFSLFTGLMLGILLVLLNFIRKNKR